MKTNWQDPGSGEILSTYISGLQEAVGKIEDTLKPSITSVTNVTLEEILIYEGDRYRIYQSPGKRNWLADPAPVIKVNGVVRGSGYAIEYGGGGVVFSPPLSEGDMVTADFAYVVGGSEELDEVSQDIAAHKADNTPHREAVSIERKNPDDDGVFTLIEFRRPDGTLFKTSQLNGTSPYTSRTVKYYDKDENLMQTVEYSITYSDDEMISEVIISA